MADDVPEETCGVLCPESVQRGNHPPELEVVAGLDRHDLEQMAAVARGVCLALVG